MFTKYAPSNGDRLVLRPASVGHEYILPEPDVLAALFGSDHRIVTAPTRYIRTIYGERDPTTGTLPEVGHVEDFDPFELRRLALAENLLGRFGYFRGVPVVMLWNTPPGWVHMVAAIIERIGVPDDGVVTAGSSVLGTVADLRASRAAGNEHEGGAG